MRLPHDLCRRCGVYRYVHEQGRGCGRFGKASPVRAWFMHHSLRAHLLAPIWSRLSERMRWRTVDRLNRSERYCWPDLVDAALCWHEGDACDIALPTPTRAEQCASACDWSHPDHVGDHECSCYCGKFQFRANEGAIDRKAGWPS